MSYIYVLYKESCSGIAKIGSTQNPIKRIKTYKTWYYSVDDEPIEYFKLYSIHDGQDCYLIDDMLKSDKMRGFSRCRERGFNNCGTELYDLHKSRINVLEQWFHKNNVNFTSVDIQSLSSESETDEGLLSEIMREIRPVVERKTINLRGYQIPIYKRLVDHLTTHKRATMNIFCGGGKTVLYQKFIDEYFINYSTIILVVPTLNLLGDMTQRFSTLCSALKINMFQIGSHVDGSTDSDSIRQFIEVNERSFIISTYKSVELLVEPLQNTNKRDVLFIFDECHKCCSKIEQQEHILVKLKTIDECIKHVIFATATPKYSSIKKYIGMNNIEYFGETICNIPMTRLIREEFLCSYKIIVKEVSHQLNGVSNYYNASINILRKYITTNVVKKILLYTNSIDTIQIIFDALKNNAFFNKFDLFMAHSRMNPTLINQNKNDFVESRNVAIMVNCQLFTEGINIPELDSVVFCDPKNSESEIIQCFGRALRRDPKNANKVAKIFIPVCAVDVKNKFQKLLNIIRAISSQDPKLRDEIRGAFAIGSSSRKRSSKALIDISIAEEQYSILNFKNEKICIETMSDAIVYILRDHIPRTANKIWQEIADRELYETFGKTPEASCQSYCGKLFKSGKLKRQGSPFEYYIPQISKLTTDEFIQELIRRNIETEEGYRIEYDPYTDPKFPFDPIGQYPNFKWIDLLVKKYYTLDECIARIKSLEGSVIDRSLITDLEKNNYLSSIDPKIPKNLRVFYKKKLHQLNDIIFEELI